MKSYYRKRKKEGKRYRNRNMSSFNRVKENVSYIGNPLTSVVYFPISRRYRKYTNLVIITTKDKNV